MRKNKLSYFQIGLCVSVLIHASIAAVFIYEFNLPQTITTQTKNIAPLVLALNTFVEQPKQETIKEQQVPTKPKEKPKKEKRKEKPKDKTKPKEKPAPKKEEVVEEVPEEITEVVQEEIAETKDEIVAQQQLAQAASLKEEENLIAKIVLAINKHKGYPDRARRMNMEGVVHVEFLVTKNGDVVDPKIIKSSGYKILDTHTIKSIKTASIDFPSLPKDIKIKAPISYSLRNI